MVYCRLKYAGAPGGAFENACAFSTGSKTCRNCMVYCRLKYAGAPGGAFENLGQLVNCK